MVLESTATSSSAPRAPWAFSVCTACWLLRAQRPSARASCCWPCPSLSRAGLGTAMGAAGWHGTAWHSTARLTSTRAVQPRALQAAQRGDVHGLGYPESITAHCRRCVLGWGRFVAGKGGSVPQQHVLEVGSVTGTCSSA